MAKSIAKSKSNWILDLPNWLSKIYFTFPIGHEAQEHLDENPSADFWIRGIIAIMAVSCLTSLILLKSQSYNASNLTFIGGSKLASMGNLEHWLILGGIAICCLAIVVYSLIGKHRSIYVAIPTALVLILSLAVIASTPRISKVMLFLTVGAAIGLARQLRNRENQSGW